MSALGSPCLLIAIIARETEVWSRECGSDLVPSIFVTLQQLEVGIL